MTKSTNKSDWMLYADSESGPLGRHMTNLVAKRTATARAFVEEEAEGISLAPLIPIGLLTLFMLWMVINPLV